MGGPKALRKNVLGVQVRAQVKQKVNGSGSAQRRAGGLPPSIYYKVRARTVQAAPQQDLHVRAHLSSHLTRITLSVPMPKAAAPFLREK